MIHSSLGKRISKSTNPICIYIFTCNASYMSSKFAYFCISAMQCKGEKLQTKLNMFRLHQSIYNCDHIYVSAVRILVFIHAHACVTVRLFVSIYIYIYIWLHFHDFDDHQFRGPIFYNWVSINCTGRTPLFSPSKTSLSYICTNCGAVLESSNNAWTRNPLSRRVRLLVIFMFLLLVFILPCGLWLLIALDLKPNVWMSNVQWSLSRINSKLVTRFSFWKLPSPFWICIHSEKHNLVC